MKLSDTVFKTVIESTPLVSIDFVIRNNDGDCFMGLRKNSPAKGYWFNLGGRILKNETIEKAQARIFLEEVGTPLDPVSLKFIGTFDHIYTDNVFETTLFGTHYVCLTYEVTVHSSLTKGTPSQHHEYKWHSVSDILAADDVHENTKVAIKGLSHLRENTELSASFSG